MLNFGEDMKVGSIDVEAIKSTIDDYREQRLDEA
jgi:hypothetical protein